MYGHLSRVARKGLGLRLLPDCSSASVSRVYSVLCCKPFVNLMLFGSVADFPGLLRVYLLK